MMVNKKQMKVGISTIYYWFHNGHLGLTKADMLYPRKRKGVKKQASPNFKPAGKSIEERPDVINLRLENGHYEIDTVLLTKIKNYCLLVLTDRRSRHQIIRLIPNKTAESVNQALTLLLGSIIFCPLLQIMVRSSNDCLRYFLRNISTTHMLTLHGREVQMKIIID